MFYDFSTLKVPEGSHLLQVKEKIKKIIFSNSEEDIYLLFLIQNFALLDNFDMSQIRDNYQRTVEFLADLAFALSIYISLAVLPEVENSNLYLSGVLCSPEGKLILKQRQIYIPQKLSTFIKAGEVINYANLEAGKVAFMLGRDCWHPETGRVMALEGVDIVLAVNNIPDNNPWYQLAGLWSQVQQNQFIAIEGSFGGITMVQGPCEITLGRTGILAPVSIEAEERDDPLLYLKALSREYQEKAGFQLLSARIDLSSLQRVRESYPLLKQLNPSFYFNEMGGD